METQGDFGRFNRAQRSLQKFVFFFLFLPPSPKFVFLQYVGGVPCRVGVIFTRRLCCARDFCGDAGRVFDVARCLNDRLH